MKKNVYVVVTANGLQAASKGSVSGHIILGMVQKTTVFMLYPHQKDSRIIPDR